eukprot:12403491-Alexandrium_andersonii.AAC.1
MSGRCPASTQRTCPCLLSGGSAVHCSPGVMSRLGLHTHPTCSPSLLLLRVESPASSFGG